MNRPKEDDDKDTKIKQVNKLLSKGDYLDEQFYESKLSNNSKYILGHKKFIIPKNFQCYDKGLYETFKNDNDKFEFGNYYRTLEIGEFKNGKLNGIGARYLNDYIDDNYEGSEICLIGNFIEGSPDGNILYYYNDGTEFDVFALSTWVDGYFDEFFEDYDEQFNVRDEILTSLFWKPGSTYLTPSVKSDKFWQEYKRLYLTINRPTILESEDLIIKKVKELSKIEIEIESTFYWAKTFINKSSTFGHYTFQIKNIFNKFNRHDSDFYKTLVNDYARHDLANYVREFEIGEFKEGKLNGRGARHLIDDSIKDGSITAIMIGYFVNGLPDGWLYHIELNQDNEATFMSNAKWKMGNLKGYRELDIKEQNELRNDHLLYVDAVISGGEQRNEKNVKWWEGYRDLYNEKYREEFTKKYPHNI